MGKRTANIRGKVLACPLCGCAVERTEGYIYCTECTYKGLNTNERKKYLKENEIKIARDFIILGSERTNKKWGVGNATLRGIGAVALVNNYPQLIPYILNGYIPEITINDPVAIPRQEDVQYTER